MPSSTFQKIRLFLSSPGDVQEERNIVHKVASEINLNHSDNYGLHLDLDFGHFVIFRFNQIRNLLIILILLVLHK